MKARRMLEIAPLIALALAVMYVEGQHRGDPGVGFGIAFGLFLWAAFILGRRS